VRRLVECRAVRAVVLLLALGVGGVAGAPTMALPPRAGVSISGDDDADDDDNSGGGGGGPFAPNSPRDGPPTTADEHLLVAAR
jgi:hypothetical protein